MRLWGQPSRSPAAGNETALLQQREPRIPAPCACGRTRQPTRAHQAAYSGSGPAGALVAALWGGAGRLRARPRSRLLPVIRGPVRTHTPEEPFSSAWPSAPCARGGYRPGPVICRQHLSRFWLFCKDLRAGSAPEQLLFQHIRIHGECF